MIQLSERSPANGATTTKGGQYAHKPAVGRDALHRMSRLEEKARVSDVSSKSLAPKEHANGFVREANGAVSAQEEVLANSSCPTLGRSSTAPSLTLDTVTKRRGSNFSESTMKGVRRDSASPIPRSPTWSLKSLSKRVRSRSKESSRSFGSDMDIESGNDGINRVVSKPRKKLSKKPPSAFTTQGYSFAASDPTKNSTPPEARKHRRSFSGSGSARGRSSSEASRSSTLPFPDLLRRRGTPRSSAINGEAEYPALYGTVRTPPDTSNSDSQRSIEVAPAANPINKAHESQLSTSTKILSSDEAQRLDLVNFALEMEKSTQKALELGATKPLPKRGNSVPLPQSTAHKKGMGTETNAKTPILSGVGVNPDTSRRSKPSGKAISPTGKPDNDIGGYRYPSFRKLIRKQKTRAVKDLSSALAPEPPAVPSKQPNLESVPSNETESPTNLENPRGYVEKQRQQVQRRSIAGYEEEVALMEATNVMGNALSQHAQDPNQPTTRSHEETSFAEKPEEKAKETTLDRHDSSKAQSLLGSRTLTKLSFRKAHTDPISKNSSDHLDKPFNEPKAHQRSKQRSPLPRALTITAPVHSSHGDGEGFPKLNGIKTNENPNQRQAQLEIKPTILAYESNTSRSLTLPVRPKRQSLMEKSPKSTSALLPSNSLRGLDSPRHTLLPLRSHPPDPKPPQVLQQQQAAVSSESFKEPTARATSPEDIKTSHPSDPATVPTENGEKPISKIFVICCKCERWHDLPTQIHKIFAGPLPVINDGFTKGGDVKKDGSNESFTKADLKGLEGKIYAAVKCSWCEHGMTKSCCQGRRGIVSLSERVC